MLAEGTVMYNLREKPLSFEDWQWMGRGDLSKLAETNRTEAAPPANVDYHSNQTWN